MEYRSLGNSGLKVSALSFGAWVTFGSQVDVDAAAEMMRIAFDAGVNFFDNAEVYADGVAEVTTLGGAVAVGQPFPTGHRFPPAHLGCRCLLLPAER